MKYFILLLALALSACGQHENKTATTMPLDCGALYNPSTDFSDYEYCIYNGYIYSVN